MAGPFLQNVSLLYLALPWVVFAAGWLRPVPAACVIGLLVLTAIVDLRSLSRTSRERLGEGPNELLRKTRRRRAIFLQATGLILLAAVWTALSGAGGWGFQNLDWLKHNQILSDLSTERWPVDYTVLQQTGSRSVPLTYYLAYYLPAAAAGKALGWRAANDVLYFHTVLGVLLALLWFAALTGRGLLRSALLFPVLSGLDVIGRVIWSEEGYGPTAHLEWWAGMGSVQYSSNTSLLFWVPQHAIAGWILTGLVVQRARDEHSARVALFALALGMLWSPFVTLGLAPFVIAAALVSGRRGTASFANFAAAPALAVVALLFLASRAESPPNGWWFEEGAPPWLELVAFYVLELSVVAASYPSAASDGTRRGRTWWWIASAMLLVLPLYRVGRFNDLTMRASIPALFVLWSYVAAALQDRAPARRRILLALLVLIGAVTPANEIMRALARYKWALPEVDERPLMAQDILYRFYLGDGDSWFFRHLARPLRQVVTVEAEHPRQPIAGTRSEPSAAASDGRILVLDDRSDLALTYGFELVRPIRAASLVARHRSVRATSFEVRVDGAAKGRLNLPQAGEWRFSSMKLRGALDAGWHELVVRGPMARNELDLFVLIEEEPEQAP